MLDRRTVFEIHRLTNEKLSIRKISKSLRVSRKTVRKYLKDPNPQRPKLKRKSKLDPFRDPISRILEIDPKASAVVIHQRLCDLGFTGSITILREYLAKVRPPSKKRQAVIRFESAPGE
ncbi:MAG: IS21 family transposase, partial [candidate division Zixibacteria bacterium]|nr:IS21 family transposase [candidate division Zixibacteria bacterium]